MSHLRLTAAALIAALALVPSLATAGPIESLQECQPELEPDAALCVAAAGGAALAQAVSPVGPTVGSVDDLTVGPLAMAGICDDLDTAHCLLPFPNDKFTVADPTTDTGRRVNFSPLAMPRNIAGKPVDPIEWNKNDGFSPGSPVMTVVPGVDLQQSGAAPISNIARSLEADSPIVLLNATTGARHPHWAELDSNAPAGEPRALIVRPAVNFDEGTRYIVAMRVLRDATGAVIPAGAAFLSQRGVCPISVGAPTPDESIFATLIRAGVACDDLFIAWDFTVASERNLTERMLHIRDNAFASLAGAAPAFTVDAVTNTPGVQVTRTVSGSFTVPNYLIQPVNVREPALGTDPGTPAARFLDIDLDNHPERNGDMTATFTCRIPRSVLAHPTRAMSAPSRRGLPSLYGHGLLGGQDEVGAGNVTRMADENGIVFCATDWYGMATGDVPTVGAILADMSNFPALADRVQQGMLAQLFLARLLKHSAGLASDPAFKSPTGGPLLDTREVVYDGNSQGGIIGGALVAVSTDITKAVLGVPAMNYSTLLDRSVDFDQYEAIFSAAYPNELEREIIFSLIQMLWDRAEANGYAHHMTDDPLPDTPAHRVLMHVAFGDHQVANIAAEVEARTIGARTNSGFLAAGRHWATDQTWGIPTFSGSWNGSGFVYWDSGTPAPPNGNIAPSDVEDFRGDPHSDPRSTRLARNQKGLFLRSGVVTDVCSGGPCKARPLSPEV